jgi:hypothetical protein
MAESIRPKTAEQAARVHSKPVKWQTYVLCRKVDFYRALRLEVQGVAASRGLGKLLRTRREKLFCHVGVKVRRNHGEK